MYFPEHLMKQGESEEEVYHQAKVHYKKSLKDILQKSPYSYHPDTAEILAIDCLDPECEIEVNPTDLEADSAMVTLSQEVQKWKEHVKERHLLLTILPTHPQPQSMISELDPRLCAEKYQKEIKDYIRQNCCNTHLVEKYIEHADQLYAEVNRFLQNECSNTAIAKIIFNENCDNMKSSEYVDKMISKLKCFYASHIENVLFPLRLDLLFPQNYPHIETLCHLQMKVYGLHSHHNASPHDLNYSAALCPHARELNDQGEQGQQNSSMCAMAGSSHCLTNKEGGEPSDNKLGSEDNGPASDIGKSQVVKADVYSDNTTFELLLLLSFPIKCKKMSGNATCPCLKVAQQNQHHVGKTLKEDDNQQQAELSRPNADDTVSEKQFCKKEYKQRMQEFDTFLREYKECISKNVVVWEETIVNKKQLLDRVQCAIKEHADSVRIRIVFNGHGSKDGGLAMAEEQMPVSQDDIISGIHALFTHQHLPRPVKLDLVFAQCYSKCHKYVTDNVLFRVIALSADGRPTFTVMRRNVGAKHADLMNLIAHEEHNSYIHCLPEKMLLLHKHCDSDTDCAITHHHDTLLKSYGYDQHRYVHDYVFQSKVARLDSNNLVTNIRMVLKSCQHHSDRYKNTSSKLTSTAITGSGHQKGLVIEQEDRIEGGVQHFLEDVIDQGTCHNLLESWARNRRQCRDLLGYYVGKCIEYHFFPI